MTLIAVKWTYLKRNIHGLFDARQKQRIKSNTLSGKNSNSLSLDLDESWTRGANVGILPCNDQSDQALVVQNVNSLSIYRLQDQTHCYFC